ncbi:hypothetical protein BV898_15957 [Hypsibius exemplaris]|uniref:Uncharacterized protein n=1 Tax=Hypsibius exemplaris TaxID=2072580 RepID=A0A9X6NJ04_HYPEX|nr:hypothetical protein BV898_15957 [Hypsibius exemplaris]
MKTCGLCSLKTGCYLVALYTIILGVLLLGFNGYEWHFGGGYENWSHITSVIFAIALFFAGGCLFLGLRKNSNALVGVWTVIFLIYVVVQIAYIIYGIVNWISYYDSIPASVRQSRLANIIVFAILIVFNLWCLATVRSYRSGGISGMNIVV